MQDTYKDFKYKIKQESGKYKPLFSINIGVMLPIALEGYDLQYTENRYLISGTKEKAKEVALKLIDELTK